MRAGRGAAISKSKLKKKKEDLTEEEEEELAAEQIQAVWKGKQERRALAARKEEQQQQKILDHAAQQQQQQALLDQFLDEEQAGKQEDQEGSNQAGEERPAKAKTPPPLPRYDDEDEDDLKDDRKKHIKGARYKIYLLFEDPTSSHHAQIISIVILATILFSISCFMVETMPDFKDVTEDTWLIMELICTVVFSLEYIVRFLVCDVVGLSQWKFVRDPMNVCDFIAILPFYVAQIGKAAGAKGDMAVFRAFRLSRLLRIFKLARYSSGMRLMAEALSNSFRALSVLLFFLCIGIVLFSSSLYNVERISCPSRADLRKTGEEEKYMMECYKSSDGWSQNYGLCCDEHDSPNDFPSIMEGFWWCIVTMTTVGFGEVYPKSTGGKLVGILTMLAGLLLISLPVAIVGRKFQEVYEDHFHNQEKTNDPKQRVGKENLSDDGTQMKELGRKIRKMKVTTKDGEIALTTQIQELAELFDEAEAMARAVHLQQLADINRELDIHDAFDKFLDDFKVSLVNQRARLNPALGPAEVN